MCDVFEFLKNRGGNYLILTDVNSFHCWNVLLELEML
jgi:hypothetical protein